MNMINKCKIQYVNIIKIINKIINNIFIYLYMKHNIYFTHIPKTAGSTIESIFFYKDYLVGEGYFRGVIKKIPLLL